LLEEEVNHGSSLIDNIRKKRELKSKKLSLNKISSGNHFHQPVTFGLEDAFKIDGGSKLN
jgi:hypothetical protein